MNINVEIPCDTLLTSRSELKEVIRELLLEFGLENSSVDVMTIKETAKFMKVSVPTVRNLIASKDIPYFQRGQVIRLNRQDVQGWMRQNPTEHISKG